MGGVKNYFRYFSIQSFKFSIEFQCFDTGWTWFLIKFSALSNLPQNGVKCSGMKVCWVVGHIFEEQLRYEWLNMNSNQIFSIVWFALKWSKMQQIKGMLSGWSQFWRITEVWVVKHEFWPNVFWSSVWPMAIQVICIKINCSFMAWRVNNCDAISFENL